MEAPEKPCPWHAETINPHTGRLGSLYCEVGPEGHSGSHLGERSRNEYLRRLRAWRRGSRNNTNEKGKNGTTEHAEQSR